jgi:hypothetical protein
MIKKHLLFSKFQDKNKKIERFKIRLKVHFQLDKKNELLAGLHHRSKKVFVSILPNSQHTIHLHSNFNVYTYHHHLCQEIHAIQPRKKKFKLFPRSKLKKIKKKGKY